MKEDDNVHVSIRFAAAAAALAKGEQPPFGGMDGTVGQRDGTGRDASGEQKTRREKSENSRDSEGNDGGRQVRRQSQISNEEYITHKSRFVLCFYFVDWILDLYCAYPSIHCHPCNAAPVSYLVIIYVEHDVSVDSATQLRLGGQGMRCEGWGMESRVCCCWSAPVHFILLLSHFAFIATVRPPAISMKKGRPEGEMSKMNGIDSEHFWSLDEDVLCGRWF